MIFTDTVQSGDSIGIKCKLHNIFNTLGTIVELCSYSLQIRLSDPPCVNEATLCQLFLTVGLRLESIASMGNPRPAAYFQNCMQSGPESYFAIKYMAPTSFPVC